MRSSKQREREREKDTVEGGIEVNRKRVEKKEKVLKRQKKKGLLYNEEVKTCGKKKLWSMKQYGSDNSKFSKPYFMFPSKHLEFPTQRPPAV